MIEPTDLWSIPVVRYKCPNSLRDRCSGVSGSRRAVADTVVSFGPVSA